MNAHNTLADLFNRAKEYNLNNDQQLALVKAINALEAVERIKTATYFTDNQKMLIREWMGEGEE